MPTTKKKPGPAPQPKPLCAYPGCTEPVKKTWRKYHSKFHRTEHAHLLRLLGERVAAPREDHHPVKNPTPAALLPPVQPPPIRGAPL